MSDEGEDPSPRPKRKIKKVMVLSSESSSDSDDSGPTTSTHRKRLRVVSEDGAASDSSSGSWATGALRRRCVLPGLRDSDGYSDSSGWATDHEDARPASSAPSTSVASRSPYNNAAKPASGFCSDSSEGNSEKCSICLMKFLNQEVGIPQNCEHIFCLDCITEWSKNMNTCPVDRLSFDSIIVRAGVGGRVLRTEVVKVPERRPSLEMMIIEDPTVCEVCHNADREESMLLCDGCDHGFHMQCLTPPLTRIPEDQWLCSYCARVWRVAALEDYEGSQRAGRGEADEPATSSGRSRGARPAARPAPRPAAAPSTSRAAHPLAGASGSARRTAPTPRTRKRKYKRRTRTVIVEYELEGEGKFPITKTRRVKTRVKKRKMKRRQPRTAARRSHVLASVRAKLAAARHDAPARSELAARRGGAGIPALSLFGDDHQLDYFAEEEEPALGSERASTAVATRPTPTMFSAYRQARRKMITIPSRNEASSAADLLSDILESQARLHSKHSVLSVSTDGAVAIELPARGSRPGRPARREEPPLAHKPAVDLRQPARARQTPAYPGQGRGWGGGYRYPREQNHHQNQPANQAYGRGGDRGGGGGYDNGFGGPPRGAPGLFHRGEDNNGQFNDYDNRRPHHYSNDDEPWHDRNRRQPDQNRGPNNQRNEERRFSAGGPAWRPNWPAGPPGPLHRHSFGGFENPLDMRVAHEPAPAGAGFSRAPPFLPEPPADKPQPYRPLPLPPSFELVAAPPLAPEPDDDERSDEGLIIDTEKYDPTEPTHDDDSAEEEVAAAPSPPAPSPPATEEERAPSPPRVTPLPPPPLPLDASSVESILAGFSSSGLHVPADVLDSAVRQALEEHRALLSPAARELSLARRLGEGDCPNFSIYSATSVHIASDAGRSPRAPLQERRNSLEDLVQEDGDLTPPPPPAPLAPPLPDDSPSPAPSPAAAADRTLQEYKAKVSKRCPITINTRNPIKIRLHPPALIKRHLPLYDDDDLEPEPELESSEPPQDRPEPEPGRTEPEPEPAVDDPMDEEKVSSEPEPELEGSPTPDGRSDGADGRQDAEPEGEDSTSHVTDEEATPERTSPPRDREECDDDYEDDGRTDAELEADNDDDKDKRKSDSEESSSSRSERAPSPSPGRAAGAGAKMTESISETEDERSYTPCLDEHKPAPAPAPADIAALGTELISDEEAQDMFSEGSPAPAPLAAAPEDGEILDRRPKDDAKKKRRKDAKKEARAKGRKRTELAFKKIGKGKERNYRERDKEKTKRRSASSSESRARRRRKDKRKDLARYDVRVLVSERRRRAKDAFGRDVSPGNSEPDEPPRASPRRARLSSGSPRRARLASGSPRRVRLASGSPRRVRLASGSPHRARLTSSSPRRARLTSGSPRRARLTSESPRRARLTSGSPRRARLTSGSPRRGRLASGSPRRGHLASGSPRRGRLASGSPRRGRLASGSPRRGRLASGSPRRGRLASASPRRVPSNASVRRSPSPAKRRRKRSGSRVKASRRRRSTSKVRKRRRPSASPATSPKPSKKKKKRGRSSRAGSPSASARRRSPRRKRARRRASPPAPASVPAPAPAWSPPRALSPRTPPPAAPLSLEERRRRRDMERAHRRLRDATGPSKEVFTSGDNILVSVSFKEQERAEGGGGGAGLEGRRARRRSRRRARAAAPDAAAKPVAIIDLERSPFRELTPSPKHVIVLSDDEPERAPPPPAPGGAAAAPPPAPASASASAPAPAPAPAGPKTPPDPAEPAPATQPSSPKPTPDGAEGRGPLTPPEPPDSPDAYDPYEPTRSASGSPAPPAPPSAAPLDRVSMTLEAAQKTNLSADEVLDRRPLSPIEKVLALLQSTRDESPEAVVARAPGPPGAPPSPPAALSAAPPAAPPPRVLLPSDAQPRLPPKLFLAKPSPIKSDPIKPMPQATKLSRLPLPMVVAGVRRRSLSPGGGGGGAGASPYSPGSSDFGDLFEPPAPLHAYKRHRRNGKPKRGYKGKTTVDVKLDDDNLKILDELPSSAVEMQVKSKFLKKLNRQERVVEEVKLVLKPHYNKKHVSKDEYKHILRRAVPKICHNKTGEINPMKIQSLVEAYVKKFRKKRKLGQ